MKTRIITAIVLATIGLASCSESDTFALRDQCTEDACWYSGEFDVNRWTKVSDRDGLNSYYMADIRVPRLDYEIMRGGLVNCYLFVNSNTQTPLPCVRHYENADGQLWTRTIDFEYYNGGVTVFVTDSDFSGDVPDSMTFRIMLSW